VNKRLVNLVKETRMLNREIKRNKVLVQCLFDDLDGA